MSIYKYPFRILKKILNKKIIINANKKRHPKRALLIYLTQPFKIDKKSKIFKNHTNYWRNIEIARILDTFGYTVDVVDHHEAKFKPKKDYDLILGLGVVFEKMVKQLPKCVKKIYLSTGSEANFFNKVLTTRVSELNKNANCNLRNNRTNRDDSSILKMVEAIICLGNDVTTETYRPYFKKHIDCFNNHGYDELSFFPKNKNYEKTKKNFLFLCGSGKVLNGLDLLLDIFKNKPNLNLYIGGSFNGEEDFVDCYKKELYDTPNIHTEGWLSIGSPRFNELIETCSTIIVPICAGASHGSVVNCMNYGLIPIVTKEAGIDTENFGITLPSYAINDIEKTVDWVSNQSAEWHKKMSNKTYKVSKKKFSQSAFTQRLTEIFKRIHI